MYSIIFLLVLIFLLLIMLFKLLNFNKNYMMCTLITIFIFFFISNLTSCIDAALVGLNLVIKTILPTIFPFSVICNLLISYDGISLYSKLLGPILCKPLHLSKASSFPIVASLISGYPLGCKYCCDLYSQDYIDRDEFIRLLNIASNASPMFIVGAIGVTMFGDIKLGFILLIANYLSPFIVGFLTIKNSHKMTVKKTFPSKHKNTNFGLALKNALENGINVTLQIGSFVILFSIIMSIIKNNTIISIVFSNIEELLHLPSYSLYGLFLGSIEFTNGCKLISTTLLSLPLRLSIVSFICSFSGLSVIAQISSFISEHSVSLTRYTFYKVIQGIISFLITFIVSSVFLNAWPASTNTIIIPYSNRNFIFYFTLLTLPVICTLFYSIIKKLHTS